jgi:thiol:disulfide interchange protein DsbD
MRIFIGWTLGLLLASPAAYCLSGKTVATDNVKARLVSETGAIGPGQSIWIALELDIRAGWHTYWRNPGDSGQATTLNWSLPPGFTAGDIVWTTPHRFDLPPLANYGYANHAVHLVQITAPRDLKPGATVDLHAKAGWLVCADVCIPEDAELNLSLPAASTAAVPDPTAASLFAAARADLPRPAPAPASASLRDGKLVLTLGPAWGATLPSITSLAFFPYDEGSIEYAAPQTLTRSKDGLELAMKTGDQPLLRGPVRGVLLATEQTGGLTVPIEISAPLTNAADVVASAASGATAAAAAGPAAGATLNAAAAAGPEPPVSAHSAPAPPALLSLILLAILGGLILNLMPCVFPVLSIKAIGLAEQAKKHPAEARTKGLVFAAGVLCSMLTLALVLLALRAGGEQVGWGFQLQSPVFVTLMIYLLLAVGLNLSGVFEVGGGLTGLGDGLTRGDGYRASFFTGVLTTLVATPCTAPFMAAAVGAALTQSPLVALVIFAALGLGLSLPYVLLSFAPWTRRILPKPGAWMETLKQIFAFPMYASAAWLLWVLAQQTSSFGLGAALAGAILIAVAGWAYQKSKSSRLHGRVTALVTAAAALALALLLPFRYAGFAAASTGAATIGGGRAAGSEADDWQPYDAARAAALSAAGRPLLINFTASWCLTCLVNERNAFADSAVQAVFHDKGVTLMRGDWTNRDPSITKALTAFGRAGVPLYVVYNAEPGTSEPLILPQLLTANIVERALLKLPARDLK